MLFLLKNKSTYLRDTTLVWSQPYDVSAAIGPQNPMPARPFGKNRTKGPFKNKFRFCWRLFGLLARRERRAYPQRSVRSEQRSQQAKEPQPGGAGRRRAICFVAVGHSPTVGDAPSSRLASGPTALPPKSEVIFER